MVHHTNDVVQLLISINILLINLRGRLDHGLSLFSCLLCLSLLQGMEELLLALSGLHPHGLVFLLERFEGRGLLGLDTTFVSSSLGCVVKEG